MFSVFHFSLYLADAKENIEAGCLLLFHTKFCPFVIGQSVNFTDTLNHVAIIALSFPSTDKALKNHLFHSKIVRSEMECTLTCLLSAQCESFNYQDNIVGARHICELNDQTRFTRSRDLLQRNGFSYYGSSGLVRK